MKRFYIIFFVVCLAFFGLMYYSIWWFMGALATLMIFVAYRFYAVRLEAFNFRNRSLEDQLEQLQVQLDSSINKEIKAEKDMKQLKQVKQQFLQVISHEIRTPMNGIMGMSTLLAGTSLNEEQKEYTNTIRRCGDNLLRTVNELLVADILNFSKLDGQEQELENKDFDPYDCVAEVLDMFASRTVAAGVDLICDIENDVPGQIRGDRKRLQQVLMNLVENAVKFTPYGEILVAVRTVTPDAGRAELKFEVRDSGSGIRNEQLAQLFKGVPPASSEPDTGTTGFGLVICKKLVELMGGNIEVKSDWEKGTSFTFAIPLIPGSSWIAHAKPVKHLNERSVLIVDHNATRRNVSIKQMQLWGVTSYIAETGKKALAILAGNENIELVILNPGIEDMTGNELALAIKAMSPGMKILLMNPAGDETYKQEPGLFAAVLAAPALQKDLGDRINELFFAVAEDSHSGSKKLSGDFSKQYPLRLLIAEDNNVNQKLAMKMLTKLGYEPVLARDGKEVMEMVSHDHYDMILMDVQMPVMDGLEATRMIRTCLEVQPVIMAVTANVMMGDRDECMQAGMDDYISKPIELDELLERLEKWALVIKNKRRVSVQ